MGAGKAVVGVLKPNIGAKDVRVNASKRRHRTYTGAITGTEIGAAGVHSVRRRTRKPGETGTDVEFEYHREVGQHGDQDKYARGSGPACPGFRMRWAAADVPCCPVCGRSWSDILGVRDPKRCPIPSDRCFTLPAHRRFG